MGGGLYINRQGKKEERKIWAGHTRPSQEKAFSCFPNSQLKPELEQNMLNTIRVGERDYKVLGRKIRVMGYDENRAIGVEFICRKLPKT